MELYDILSDNEISIESIHLLETLQSCFREPNGIEFSLLNNQGFFLQGDPLGNETLYRIEKETLPELFAGNEYGVLKVGSKVLLIIFPISLQNVIKGFVVGKADLDLCQAILDPETKEKKNLVAFLIGPVVHVIDSCCRLNEILNEKKILKTRVKHLTNSMDVLREQHQEIQSINLKQREELEEKNESLEDYGRNLEQKVSERTLELKHAKEKAEESDKSKSEFLANMSHEMRTPLNSIIGFVEMLQEESLSSSHHDYLGRVFRNSHLLLNLIDDILDLSKLQARQMKVEQVPPCLIKLVDDTIPNAGSLMAGLDKQLEVRSSIETDIQTKVLSDPKRLQQVMNNLVGNAVKFTQSGTIDISITLNDDKELVFTIKDTGIGIPLEKQEQIFESFKQGDGSTTRKYGGTGLGLTITKQIVNLMGGAIRVESKVGSGSVFSFTLPYRPTDKPATPEDVNQDRKAVGEPLNILLVDDSPDNLLLAQTILNKMGHHVSTATDGQAAVDCYQRQPAYYDIILMDIQMPDMDGLEATGLIRRHQEHNGHKRVPVIALTAGAMEGDKKVCLDAGCDDYLKKPIDKKRLAALLEKHTGGDTTQSDVNEQPENSRIVVDVDHDLQDLIPGYLENKKNDINKIQNALAENDYETIRLTGHSMKGSGSGYGFDFISQIGLALESAAQSKDIQAIKNNLKALNTYLNRVDVRYKTL